MAPVQYSRRIVIAVLGFMVVVALVVFLVSLATPKKQTASYPNEPVRQTPSREPARVYIGKFEPYRQDVDADIRSRIETVLYGYIYFLNGKDLYTGRIRDGSYAMKKMTDGSFDLQMLVDIYPVTVTYKVSVVKNKNTGGQQSFVIACAPKSQQKNTSVRCFDEEGS